nr:DUF2063 domain-containing protein [Parachlamydiaceae bacterium]
VKYPPRHWSLSLIGDRLALWTEENYSAVDKLLILDAINLDWAFNYSFVAPEGTPLSSEHVTENKNEIDSSSLLKKIFFTQPHLHLFSFDCDMFNFRIEFLKQPPDYWVEHDFPDLKHDKPIFYCLFRNSNNDTAWKEISQVEYLLLSLFEKGSSIEKACDWLEKQDEALCEVAMKNLHLWFQEWTVRRWLTSTPSSILQGT